MLLRLHKVDNRPKCAVDGGELLHYKSSPNSYTLYALTLETQEIIIVLYM